MPSDPYIFHATHDNLGHSQAIPGFSALLVFYAIIILIVGFILDVLIRICSELCVISKMLYLYKGMVQMMEFLP